MSLTDLGMVQQLTGDYPAAAAGYERALALFRSVGSPFDEADALCELGVVQRLTGDHATAAASQRQALDLFRRLGDRLGQAWALDELGLVQQLTGDYPAAAGSAAEAAAFFRDLGSRQGLAMALNSLGELASSTRRPGRPGAATARRSPSRRRSARPPRKLAPWPESAGACCPAVPPRQPATCGRRWRSTRRIGSPEARRIRDTLAGHGLGA